MNIQTFLVIGSIAALTFTILNMNNHHGQQTEWELNNEATISGTGIGQSIFEKIELASFDENTISKMVTSTDSLSSSVSFNDPGETTHYLYDDIDDYDGYKNEDTLDRLGVFTTEIEVYYVTTMFPDTKISNRSFSKRINIFVSNEYLIDTLVFSKVICY
jgi:hypothetical protein